MSAREGKGTGRGRTVAARLRAAKQRVFVGRESELELFAAALAEHPPPFTVLYLHGPGGVGKSTLLDRFASLAETAGRSVTRLDGRELDRTPDTLQRAFLDGGHAAGVPRVLLVDAYEALAPVDGWLREAVLPQLDASAVVVLAGSRGAPPSLGSSTLSIRLGRWSHRGCGRRSRR